ncbi:hypothetical protein QWY97_20335 [Vibrio cortegadensis]|uniref:hypothetical protein n=1 Tax=Vibrio cortegadensis TaxID=1328770 RepID=UPI0021C2641F|nr:hypothetical protein [Vibrio cortegadensis]MDN3699657.1 hypothetical protein [Vibrio cortegadensis]
MYLHLLIKFGKSSYLPKFRSHGQFRMGSFKSYRASENGEIGDLNEGAHRVGRHHDVTISKLNPDTNDYEQIAYSNDVVSRHFNEIYEGSRIFCMYYAIVEVQGAIQLSDVIDVNLLNDFEYDHVVIIHDLKTFYERLDSYFDKTGIAYRRGTVEYIDFSNGIDFLTPFKKDIVYSHQQEFRLCIQGISGDKAHDVEIGSLSDISFECNVKEIQQLKIRCQ